MKEQKMTRLTAATSLALLASGFASAAIAKGSVTPYSLTAPGNIAHSCEQCTEQQILRYAESMGPGWFYIYDPANALHLIDVECEIGPGGVRQCFGTEGDVPSAASAEFNQYKSAYLANGSESFADVASVSLPSGGPVNQFGQQTDNGSINAYDTVYFSNYNNQVVAYLNNPGHYNGFYAIVVGILNYVNAPVIQFDKMNAVVVVNFPDKSKRTYQFDKALRTYGPVVNTAIDGSNNTIPEKGTKPATGEGFFFSPLGPSYDRTNMNSLFGDSDPNQDPYCVEEVWDGQRLTCVHAN